MNWLWYKQLKLPGKPDYQLTGTILYKILKGSFNVSYGEYCIWYKMYSAYIHFTYINSGMWILKKNDTFLVFEYATKIM